MQAGPPTLVCRMLSTEPLTSADLDRLGQASFDHDQPDVLVAELVAAVEQGRIADQADTGYALLLAAEITERAADANNDTAADAVDAALGLSERAITAYRAHGNPDYGYPRAFRAGLLLRAGREDEAMAELTALRPLLCEDDDAVSYLSDVLQQHGRTALAEQWLSTALTTALQRRHAPRALQGRADAAYERAATMAFTLAQHRYRLRRELDLPHDHHDELAERLLAALVEELHPHTHSHTHDRTPIAVLFWPHEQFNNLLKRWPPLTESYGHNWDEHRAHIQRRMTLYSESGHTHLALIAGHTDELAAYANQQNTDPTDPHTRQSYAQHLTEHPNETPWPPARNQTCWCGSGTKYKRCCLPRARTS